MLVKKGQNKRRRGSYTGLRKGEAWEVTTEHPSSYLKPDICNHRIMQVVESSTEEDPEEEEEDYYCPTAEDDEAVCGPIDIDDNDGNGVYRTSILQDAGWIEDEKKAWRLTRITRLVKSGMELLGAEGALQKECVKLRWTPFEAWHPPNPESNPSQRHKTLTPTMIGDLSTRSERQGDA